MVGACKMLTHLSLLRCTGPLGDELGMAFAGRDAVLPLRELHIQGGASALTDSGLLLCIFGWVNMLCLFPSCSGYAAQDRMLVNVDRLLHARGLPAMGSANQVMCMLRQKAHPSYVHGVQGAQAAAKPEAERLQRHNTQGAGSHQAECVNARASVACRLLRR